MQLFTNIDDSCTGVIQAILPYVNIIKGYEEWSDDEYSKFLNELKEIYYIAPYINTSGDLIRSDMVETISFRLDGNIEKHENGSFQGLMHIVDTGHLFSSTGTYQDFESFCLWFPIYLKGNYRGANTGDDYLYFKVFDNKEEAQEDLRKWNEENKAKQQEKKKAYAIRLYNNLIKDKENIEHKIDEMRKNYDFLA